ncbi:DUF1036 domain-containing protein [Leisingera sp. ANG-Vp]|uniref:DUF1036 domain-containing protein n=1 Tax=Leisingera sp. ANG-Vp TaxID=1577896 RepID=UPI001F4D1E4D|nr:DUF1036 domain-containing protein [Leisingera sp. ANG-Vp]
MYWLPLLLTAALTVPQAGFAAVSICNDTSELHNLAVSSRGDEGWVTNGWHPLRPGDCRAAVPEGHQGKYFYYRAESPGHRFRDDGIRFCTASGGFRIKGNKKCASRGYAKQGFAKARVDAEGHKILLSTRSQRNAAALPEAAAGAHQAYAAEVVFQGCAQLRAEGRVRCRFVAGGMELSTEGGSGFATPQFAYLQGLQSGAPLFVDGLLTSALDAYGELVLRSVAPRQPNRFDRMLQQMQGEWSSAQDPQDRFVISGSVRQSSYQGSRMPPELVSVQGSCRGVEQSGDFLMAWDRERGTSLCYRIQALTAEELALVYLPRGTRLIYRRPKGS